MEKFIFIITCFSCFSIYLKAGTDSRNLKLVKANQICSGINIHFVSGQENDLDMIAAAGFRFIRMDFGWQDIESTKSIYNWAAYDELTANLNKRGMGAIFIFDYSDSLYEDQVKSTDPLINKEQTDIASPQKSESIAAFARWASASASNILLSLKVRGWINWQIFF
jgi:hypothetical protein